MNFNKHGLLNIYWNVIDFWLFLAKPLVINTFQANEGIVVLRMFCDLSNPEAVVLVGIVRAKMKMMSLFQK